MPDALTAKAGDPWLLHVEDLCGAIFDHKLAFDDVEEGMPWEGAMEILAKRDEALYAEAERVARIVLTLTA